jgi:DnaJ-class molecular chaperone
MSSDVSIDRTAYEVCYKCRGAGMQDSIWEPTCCSVCNGNCVIRIRDARGRFATRPVSEASS